MSDLARIDAEARERALDIGTSFIVQAPAGSGKTTVLTQRYLKLLASMEQPEQVLAITFTRKAAGEMRERVQAALGGQVEARTPADALTLQLAAAARANAQRRGWGLEESAARLRIQTIDSFNGYLANSLPITSRNGFGRTIADDPSDLYLLAAREAMRGAESDPGQRRDLERILRRLDDSWTRLERLIAGMLPRRSEWLPNLPQLSGEDLVPRIERSLEEIIGEELAEAASVFSADFVTQASALARFACQHVEPASRPDLAAWRGREAPLGHEISDLACWRAIASLALTEKQTPRQKFTKNDGIPAGNPLGKALRDDWVERLRLLDTPWIRALSTLGSLPDPRIPADARDALESLSRLLLQAAALLRTLFDSHGECDHPEVAGAARQALTQDGSPTPLAERIGTHLLHILIDEFQDTSRDQYELLRALTQDWSDGDGRTLFLVGDPMQSIYGFRNAEVGRFATVRAGGLGQLHLESLTLRRNFRSAPGLVEWGNQTFARVFPARDDVRRSAVPHLASLPGRDIDGEARLYRVDGDRGSQAEALRVAAQIAEIQASRPGDSIAVLAGARPHLRGVRAALNARGIPFIGVKLEPLADVPVVRDLEALARALESPLDRVAWLAVLRAPFIGLTLTDLTVVSDAAGEASIAAALIHNIAGLSREGADRLLRARPVLLGAWQNRERERRAHLVERTWLALGGASACARAEDLVQARRFLAALDDADRKRLKGRPLDLAEVMADLFAEDPAQPGAVSLMTIHGAKGLEFEHVFVVGVGRRGRGDEARLLNWLELPRDGAPDHLLMAPIRYRGGEAEDSDDDAINQYVNLLHRERARAERTRLAYVALTRAKRSLHLFVHPIVTDKDGERGYRAEKHSLLENLWPALEADIDGFITVVHDEVDSATEDGTPPQARTRLPRLLPPVIAPPDVIAREELEPLGIEDEPIEFSWARQTARRIGTVVHETLERFSRALPSLAELPAWRPRFISRLEALGVEPERAREGAEVALRALAGTLSDARGRWLFDASHAEASSELALSGVRGGHVVNVVIDRTFVDREGIRWVVDFKTSPHEGGDLDFFLDEEVKRYQSQLQRYAQLARGLGPQKVKAGLYYPLLAAWREVPV